MGISLQETHIKKKDEWLLKRVWQGCTRIRGVMLGFSKYVHQELDNLLSDLDEIYIIAQS